MCGGIVMDMWENRVLACGAYFVTDDGELCGLTRDEDGCNGHCD